MPTMYKQAASILNMLRKQKINKFHNKCEKNFINSITLVISDIMHKKQHFNYIGPSNQTLTTS